MGGILRWLALAGAAGIVSCGGAFSGSDGIGGASSTEAGNPGSGGSVNPQGDASNVSTTGTGGSAGTGGSSGGSRNEGDAPFEVDVRPAFDASGTADAAGNDGAIAQTDAGRDGIFCGSVKCNPVSQVCCAESGALDPASTLPLRCVPKGMCSGTSPMNIPCDDHADCALSNPSLPVCCVGTAFGMPNGQFILDECTIPSGCVTNANVRHAYMCSGPDDSTSCPANTVCRPGLIRPGFFTCQ